MGWNPRSAAVPHTDVLVQLDRELRQKADPRVTAVAPGDLSGHRTQWEPNHDGVPISNGFCASRGLSQSVQAALFLT